MRWMDTVDGSQSDSDSIHLETREEDIDIVEVIAIRIIRSPNGHCARL